MVDKSVLEHLFERTVTDKKQGLKGAALHWRKQGRILVDVYEEKRLKLRSRGYPLP